MLIYMFSFLTMASIVTEALTLYSPLRTDAARASTFSERNSGEFKAWAVSDWTERVPVRNVAVSWAVPGTDVKLAGGAFFALLSLGGNSTLGLFTTTFITPSPVLDYAIDRIG
jgi:hypothetical protein